VIDFNSPSQLSFQKSQETPQKANLNRKAINKSIEVAPTRLEPIIESSNIQDVEAHGNSVIYQTQSLLPNPSNQKALNQTEMKKKGDDNLSVT